jgi:hypothetical protein
MVRDGWGSWWTVHTMSWDALDRVNSLVRNSPPPPQRHHRALGTVLLQGPGGVALSDEGCAPLSRGWLWQRKCNKLDPHTWQWKCDNLGLLMVVLGCIE